MTEPLKAALTEFLAFKGRTADEIISVEAYSDYDRSTALDIDYWDPERRWATLELAKSSEVEELLSFLLAHA
jgi:hypothetical protein